MDYKYSELNKENVKEAFVIFLNIPLSTYKLTEKHLFNAKYIANNHKLANVAVAPIYAAEIEKDYKQEVVRTYVETFYNKTPYDFDNDIYRSECLRFNEMLRECDDSANQINKVNKILNGEKISIASLNKELYPESVLNASLNKKNNIHSMFADDYFTPSANIYINPSYNFYGDLAKFIIKNAARQGLSFNLSTSMQPFVSKGSDLDSMVINCRAKDLANFIDILEQYEKAYPQNIASFGATYEFLGRTRDWFSFGYVGQGNGVDRNDTNSCLDEINFVINNYVLPQIAITDYVGLRFYSDEQTMRNDFNYAFKSLDKVDKVMDVIKSTEAKKELLEYFSDLSRMAIVSSLYTRQNKKTKEKKYDMTYSQFRDRDSQKKDLDILRNESITAYFKQSYYSVPVDLTFTRGMFADLFLRKDFRESMRQYYLANNNHIGEERLDEKAQQIIDYLNLYTQYSPYVVDNAPYLSLGMQKSISAYKIETDEELENCFKYIRPFYKDDEELKKIVKSMSYDQFQKVDVDSLNRQQLEKAYIQLAGLDNIIVAMKKLNKNEALLRVRSFPHNHEEIINKEREKRGRMLYENIAKEPSENRMTLIRNLSAEARRDYYIYVKFVLRRNDLVNSMENE